MKKLIIVFLLFPILVFSQTETIKAKLIDYSKSKIPSYCGYQKEWGIFKFEITENKTNFKKGDIIFTITVCPREFMEQNLEISNYINNQIYLVTLGAMIDEKQISRRATKLFIKNEDYTSLFWFTKIERIKNN